MSPATDRNNQSRRGTWRHKESPGLPRTHQPPPSGNTQQRACRAARPLTHPVCLPAAQNANGTAVHMSITMRTTEKDNSIVNNNTYHRKRQLNSRWLADALADLGAVCSCWTRCATSLVCGTLCIGSPQSTRSLSAPVAPGCREEGVYLFAVVAPGCGEGKGFHPVADQSGRRLTAPGDMGRWQRPLSVWTGRRTVFRSAERLTEQSRGDWRVARNRNERLGKLAT